MIYSKEILSFIRPFRVLLAALSGLMFPASSYALTVWLTDYSIVALDVKTGETIWETCSGRLDFPFMCLDGGVIEAVWNDKNSEETKTLIRQSSGEIIGSTKGRFRDPCLGQAALEMTRPLMAAGDGRVFVNYEDGLSYIDGDEIRQLLSFSGHATMINVAGNLVLFHWSPHPGEIYALDTGSGDVTWHFEGWRLVQPDAEQEWNTYLFVIEDKLFVFYSATLFCLQIHTGKVIWQAEVHVPTPLWMGEGVDPLVWPVADSFLAVYYDWLYLFDSDGRLVWEYDAGMFGGSFPLLAGDRLYVASRPHARRDVRREIIPSSETALRIEWSDGTYLFKDVPLADIRDRDQVWSELNRPETVASDPKTVLSFIDTEIHRVDRTWSLDVTPVLTPDSAVYVRYDSEIDLVRVTVAGDTRAQHVVPATK